MKLYKPSWVNHDDKPIFSVDIHPDGKRFATGGQGNESGLVVIWNLAPVLSADAQSDKSVPKILCQMDNHISCVNSVRWSVSGNMLASGGDDKIIMIWKRGKGGGGVFGSSGLTKTTESWRCISTLRGHSGDVLDLAWSPQDQWLASCSVDNTIFVWDIQSLPSVVARLKGHTGLVKGVTWDPVGKFLASQSDDRSIKIWKTSDWSCQKTITEPFEECGGTTHVLRLSWSPDGQYLVSAHAMNGGGPTAQIIEREGWRCDKDFVGHRKAVTCVRFHDSILKRQAPKSNKSQIYCCVAIGSRDRSLSVWMTALQRPLVVIHDLFDDSILDLSWSANGYILLACSVDGTVASLQFSEKELGKPMNENDKNSIYQRMYGKSANLDISAQVGKDMIIEAPELLNMTNEKPKAPSLIATSSTAEEVAAAKKSREFSGFVQPRPVERAPIQTVQPTTPIRKQVETRTPDGKRRITPMFIPLDPEVNDAPLEFSSSSRSKTNIVVEKTNAVVATVTSPQKSFVESKTNRDMEVDETTIVKRASSVEKSQLDARLTKSAPMHGKIKEIEGMLTTTTSVSASEQLQLKTDHVAVITKQIATSGGKAIPIKGVAVKSAGEWLRVQVQNGFMSTSIGPLNKIVCFDVRAPDKKFWEVLVGSPIVNFNSCSKYAIVCSIDGTARILSVKTGVFVLPIINLASSGLLTAFSLNTDLVGVLTECGNIRVWNLSATPQSIHLSASCSDLTRNCFAYMFSITETGYVFLSLTNGCSYTYSKDLDSWILLNSRDPIIRYGLASNNSSTQPNVIRNMKIYPLMTFQSASNSTAGGGTGSNALPPQSNVELNSNSWQNIAKQSFIENQIELCKLINSPVELKHWYSVLGYHLSLHGTETRIRLLLDDLLGSVHSRSRRTVDVSNQILGIDKHEILDVILGHFKVQHQWQRIWLEYSEQVSMLANIKVNGFEEDDDDDMKMSE